MQATLHAPDIERLRRALETYAERGVPHAVRKALNASAFEARKAWISRIESTFTLRKAWTTRSVRVSKARGTSMSRMEAVLGSTAPYMAIQETGGTKRKGGRHGVPIPTSVSSGEGRGARPRPRAAGY